MRMWLYLGLILLVLTGCITTEQTHKAAETLNDVGEALGSSDNETVSKVGHGVLIAKTAIMIIGSFFTKGS